MWYRNLKQANQQRARCREILIKGFTLESNQLEVGKVGGKRHHVFDIPVDVETAVRPSFFRQMDIGYVGVLLQDLEVDLFIVAHDSEAASKYQRSRVRERRCVEYRSGLGNLNVVILSGPIVSYTGCRWPQLPANKVLLIDGRTQKILVDKDAVHEEVVPECTNDELVFASIGAQQSELVMLRDPVD